MNEGKFKLEWSEEDQEYVGTHSGCPSLSWLDKDPAAALIGIRILVANVQNDMKSELVNGAFGA